MYQQFDADIILPEYNFIKNETPAQSFSYKLCQFFQSVAL